MILSSQNLLCKVEDGVSQREIFPSKFKHRRLVKSLQLGHGLSNFGEILLSDRYDGAPDNVSPGLAPSDSGINLTVCS